MSRSRAAERPKRAAHRLRLHQAHLRDYALLLRCSAIMVFFQFTTNGTLFKPVNMTNLILQNSYIVIMEQYVTNR